MHIIICIAKFRQQKVHLRGAEMKLLIVINYFPSPSVENGDDCDLPGGVHFFLFWVAPLGTDVRTIWDRPCVFFFPKKTKWGQLALLLLSLTTESEGHAS